MFIRDERGSFTVEVAIILPVIISIIAICLIITLRSYQESIIAIKDIGTEDIGAQRNPKDIINNTDLIIEYIDKLKSYVKEGGK